MDTVRTGVEDCLEAERYARAERFLPWNATPRLRGVLEAAWLPDGAVRLRTDAGLFRRDLHSGTSAPLAEDAPGDPTLLPSPDGRLALGKDGNDLVVHDRTTGAVRPLTTGGEPLVRFGDSTQGNARWVTEQRFRRPTPPYALWSPTSRHILTHRVDERAVGVKTLVQSAPPGGGGPRTFRYREAVGAGSGALVESLLVDVDAGSITSAGPPIEVTWEPPIGMGEAWWDDAGDFAYVLQPNRARSSFRLVEIEAQTGSVRTVMTEERDGLVLTHAEAERPAQVRVLRDLGLVLLWSERDGFGHLWLHDLETGAEVRQLTRGAFVVREIVQVDTSARIVWFTASGREAGQSPYNRHLYRVSLDGGEPERLTDGDGDHLVEASPDGTLFLDACGRADRATRFTVLDRDGALVADLGSTDLSSLTDDGWIPPRPLVVTADDGTELWGVLYVPTDFDPEARYPMIDDVYAAALNRVPARLPSDMAGRGAWSEISYWLPQVLAELGFVVLLFDGRGGPMRGVAFREFGWTNTIDDHAAAIPQIVASHPFIDPDRIGIYGHSAGGTIALQGIVEHGDTYRVCVSSAAPHALRLIPYVNDDQGRGRPAPIDQLGRLEGALLVVASELDEIVPPVHFARFAEALVAADKDAEIVVLPNENHGYKAHPYFLRRVCDHFVRHLLRRTPPDHRFERHPEFERGLRYIERASPRWHPGDDEEQPPTDDHTSTSQPATEGGQ